MSEGYSKQSDFNITTSIKKIKDRKFRTTKIICGNRIDTKNIDQYITCFAAKIRNYGYSSKYGKFPRTGDKIVCNPFGTLISMTIVEKIIRKLCSRDMHAWCPRGCQVIILLAHMYTIWMSIPSFSWENYSIVQIRTLCATIIIPPMQVTV